MANTILEERQDIVGQIVALRLKIKTYDVINTVLSETLESVNPMTENVRRSVIAIICQRVIAADVHERIKAATRSKRADLNLIPWTHELDAKLLEYQRTIVLSSGPARGRADWMLIAEMMKRDFQISLEPDQWMRRAGSLNMKKKNMNQKVVQ